MLSLRLIKNTFILTSLIFILAGCFGGSSSIKLSADLEAAKDVNPDPGGRPSPLVVRVYHLRSVDVFKSADFFSIYDSEVATLGQTFVRRSEFEVQPEGKVEYTDEIDLSVKYIGVIAAFRDLDNARWRTFVKLPDEKKVSLKIDLETLAVSVAVSDR